MDKEYYIVIAGEKYKVSKEVYNTYYRSREKERYFMYVKKKGKTITKNEKFIFKDSDEISFERLEELGIEIKDDFNLEEKILLHLDIEILKEELNQLSNEEYKIILELFYNCKSERQLARELNCCNVTLHNKKNKILNKLKYYLKNSIFIEF